MAYRSRYPRYVSVGERRAKAQRKMDKLREKGKEIHPVEIDGRTIARSFWGKGWCGHLESFSDYANRLPRGRTYVRNGSVCHLDVRPGQIKAIVSGSELYNVSINITKLNDKKWKSIKKKCSGQIGSMLELLQGKMSDQVMTIVTDRDNGLFPLPGEIKLNCDCPDWAVMCKHVAAAMYGVGSQLDNQPELLFLLRDVDAQELISADIALPASDADGAISDEKLGDIFGIDLDDGNNENRQPAAKQKKKKKSPAAEKKPKKPRPAKSKKTVKKTGRPKKTKQPTAPGPEKSSADSLRKIRPTGKSVARLRKRLGMSGAQFAKKLGISAASIYRWEAQPGKLKLRDHTLKALAELHSQAGKK